MEPAQFLDLIAHNTSEIIALYKPDWKCLMISRRAKISLVTKKKNLLASQFTNTCSPKTLRAFWRTQKTSIWAQKTQILTYRLRRKDGMSIWLETTFKWIGKAKYEDKPEFILAVSKDITARRNSDEMVKKFVEGVQYASDCIVMTNPTGQIILCKFGRQRNHGLHARRINRQARKRRLGGMNDSNQMFKMWICWPNKDRRLEAKQQRHKRRKTVL